MSGREDATSRIRRAALDLASGVRAAQEAQAQKESTQ